MKSVSHNQQMTTAPTGRLLLKGSWRHEKLDMSASQTQQKEEQGTKNAQSAFYLLPPCSLSLSLFLSKRIQDEPRNRVVLRYHGTYKQNSKDNESKAPDGSFVRSLLERDLQGNSERK